VATLIAVTGLGFGDCGKGLFTDALCRATGAHAVVRFNGGAQAGHNVVLPDGRHHTFSQYGAGSFVPQVLTVLTKNVVVHPTALLEETRALVRSGVSDPISRIVVDGDCRVTTPFHQAANRLRELKRTEPHGTCGVGVGETVRLALEKPDATLRYRDLLDSGQALDKLESIRLHLLRELELPETFDNIAAQREAALLRDTSAAQRWLQMLGNLLARVSPAPREIIAEILRRDGFVILEGAQGVLLDQDVGFHPHTSWSSVLPQSAQALADELVDREPVFRLGVLRTYLTRHGPGPMPTYDSRLDSLHEPHNDASGWQGSFRRGHPDSVLLRYACEVARPLDGLLISHLDYFDGSRSLRRCEAYRVPTALAVFVSGVTSDEGSFRIETLPVPAKDDWCARGRLTALLCAAKPEYARAALTNAEDAIASFEETTGLDIFYGAFGPRYLDVKQRRTLPW
jgi:adenylosuccinate synthase